MNKWFSSAWFDMTDQCATGNESQVDLHGPFSTDKLREEAIQELVDENGSDYVIAIVRFDIEGESVPEIVE
jgi:hypothetical protein